MQDLKQHELLEIDGGYMPFPIIDFSQFGYWRGEDFWVPLFPQ